MSVLTRLYDSTEKKSLAAYPLLAASLAGPLPPRGIQRDQYQRHGDSCNVERGRGGEINVTEFDCVFVTTPVFEQGHNDGNAEAKQKYQSDPIHEWQGRPENLEHDGQSG